MEYYKLVSSIMEKTTYQRLLEKNKDYETSILEIIKEDIEINDEVIKSMIFAHSDYKSCYLGFYTDKANIKWYTGIYGTEKWVEAMLKFHLKK